MNEPVRWTRMPSPLGDLLLVAEKSALCGLYMGRREPEPTWEPGEDTQVLREAAAQLAAYFAGTLRRFDVPLRMQGTPFQQRVWAALLEVPYGTTTSYGELARGLGQPGASRAVGLANGRNPVSIIVPCHRVIGSSGKLTGYGGGLDRKRLLLQHEAGLLPPW
jgi:methylated-DNA-[protein]-cysteine S-methyltransferase